MVQLGLSPEQYWALSQQAQVNPQALTPEQLQYLQYAQYQQWAQENPQAAAAYAQQYAPNANNAVARYPADTTAPGAGAVGTVARGGLMALGAKAANVGLEGWGGSYFGGMIKAGAGAASTGTKYALGETARASLQASWKGVGAGFKGAFDWTGKAGWAFNTAGKSFFGKVGFVAGKIAFPLQAAMDVLSLWQARKTDQARGDGKMDAQVGAFGKSAGAWAGMIAGTAFGGAIGAGVGYVVGGWVGRKVSEGLLWFKRKLVG